MPRNTIEHSIQQLRGTAQGGGVDPQLAPGLEQLAAELELRLRTGSAADLGVLREAVDDWVARLEAEHPNAAALLGNIANALNSMGV